jgi:porin
MSTFPFATWGARLKYKPSSKHQFQLGTYQMGKNIFDDTKHGLDFSFKNSDNLSVFIQYDWFGKITNRNARFYLGINKVMGRFPNFNTINDSNNFIRFYGHVDVEFIENITSFATISYSPQGELAKVPFQSSIGINWKGPIQSRTKDRLLFFATIGSFSNEWSDLQKKKLSSEIVLELGYRFQMKQYFSIQPALQYDIRPGGSGTINNAFIPSVMIETNF